MKCQCVPDILYVTRKTIYCVFVPHVILFIMSMSERCWVCYFVYIDILSEVESHHRIWSMDRKFVMIHVLRELECYFNFLLLSAWNRNQSRMVHDFVLELVLVSDRARWTPALRF